MFLIPKPLVLKTAMNEYCAPTLISPHWIMYLSSIPTLLSRIMEPLLASRSVRTFGQRPLPREMLNDLRRGLAADEGREFCHARL